MREYLYQISPTQFTTAESEEHAIDKLKDYYLDREQQSSLFLQGFPLLYCGDSGLTSDLSAARVSSRQGC